MTHTLVYEYGLATPLAEEAYVRDQMRAAHRYRNALVEIARGERTIRRAAIEAVPTVATATIAAEQARAMLAAAHGRVRAERVKAQEREQSDAATAAVAAAKTEYVETLRALDKARRAALSLPDVRDEFTRIDALANGTREDGALRRSGGIRKSLRAGCGVWWGTYALVEAAVDQALHRRLPDGRQIALPLWDGLDACDPGFVRWLDWGATVGAYNNAGPEATSAAWLAIEPGGTHGHVLALRVSGETWARWPMILHRPLPPDARITACAVSCEREGPRERWIARLAVHSTAPKTLANGAPDPCGEGRVAVGIGWRALDDGEALRVATWRDDDGIEGELRLDAPLLASLRRADQVRAARDALFNQAKLALAWFVATAPTPLWMPAPTQILAWRDPGRLARLCVDWRTRRFDGDADVYRLLDDWTSLPAGVRYEHGPWRGHAESWRRRDKHLWHYECAQRAQALARRRDLYRVTAAKLARRYAIVVLGDFDIREVVRAPTLDDRGDDTAAAKARSQRVLACTHQLRNAIREAFLSRGGGVETMGQPETTLESHTCPTCDGVTMFDAAKSIDWRCDACGAEWDQDRSAMRVRLARHDAAKERERSGDARGAGIARTDANSPRRETKWARIAREKREREEATLRTEGTARESGPDGAE
jgi:ribosomal protein L37AE/L43A